jgi:hypothetical protein
MPSISQQKGDAILVRDAERLLWLSILAIKSVKMPCNHRTFRFQDFSGKDISWAVPMKI